MRRRQTQSRGLPERTPQRPEVKALRAREAGVSPRRAARAAGRQERAGTPAEKRAVTRATQARTPRENAGDERGGDVAPAAAPQADAAPPLERAPVEVSAPPPAEEGTTAEPTASPATAAAAAVSAAPLAAALGAATLAATAAAATAAGLGADPLGARASKAPAPDSEAEDGTPKGDDAP